MEHQQENTNIINDEADDELEIPEESKISKTLSDKTIKTVVMLVLLLLFCFPVRRDITIHFIITIF